MPRRFRLAVPVKNAYQKKRRCGVHVNHFSLTPQSFMLPCNSQEELNITIPIDAFRGCQVQDLLALQRRIKILQSLPNGWVDTIITDSHLTKLVLDRVERVDGISRVKCSIEITSEFGWTLCYGGDKLTSSDFPLTTLPQLATSVSSLREIMEGIDSLQLSAWDSEVATLSSLQRRLKILSALPHGWVVTNTSNMEATTLVIDKVERVDGIPHVKFSVAIGTEYKWVLCVGEDRMESTNDQLAGLPQLLTSVSSVNKVLIGLESVSLGLWDYEAVNLSQLQKRLKTLSALPNGWVDTITTCPTTELIFTKVERVDGTFQAKFSVEVMADFSWTLQVGEHKFSSMAIPITNLPQALSSVGDIRTVLKALETLRFCPGNEDTKFIPVQAARKGVFRDSTGTQVVAKYVKDYLNFHTIRCVSCELLIPPSSLRCNQCCTYRKVLTSMVFRHEKENMDDSVNAESHTNIRYLKSPQIKARMQQMRTKAKVCQQRVKRLSQRLDKFIEDRGVQVDDNLHDDLATIMEESNDRVMDEYPSGSFKHIFWEQQHRAQKLKNSKSMRWEPAMIRWCLHLRHLSSSAYELLRNTGVIKLPSQRTLRDYTYHTQSAPGFSLEVDLELMDIANIQSCHEREKYVVLILDEMHIRENIVYDKHTGSIVGFANLGDINDHLTAMEKVVENDSEWDTPLANSMLVFMVRGLFSKLQFPYAQFPCHKLKGFQLYDIFWEAVERLERCGFTVLACTCDGLTVNRRFFKLHGTDQCVYKASNPYADDGHSLFFFSDPPHLVKTVRNSWCNNKRLMWFDGKYIVWSHLVKLYYRCHSNKISPGLTLLPKLKYEHVFLTSFSKMRVDLAAQVLSNSVGKAFEVSKLPDVEKTAEFVLIFDKFFDCLNVSSLDAGKHSRNAFKSPYHSKNDFRIKWLKEDFLGYLDKWEKSVQERPEDFEQKSMMLLSAPTRLGLRLTGACTHQSVLCVWFIQTIIPMQ